MLNDTYCIVNYLLIPVLVLASMLSLHGQSRPAPLALAELTNRHLVAGEQTYLIVRLQNAQSGSRPAAPEIPNTAVNFVRTVTQLDNRRGLSQVFVYRLTPAKPGNYTIPPVTLGSGGRNYHSKPLGFEVHDPARLSRVATGVAGADVLVGWFPTKTSLYAGEQCPVTLKIYVPEQLNPVNWGLPEAEKHNCLAWRFSPPSNDDLGRVSIDNKACLSAPYTTTVSGISAGKATLGPTRLRLVSRQRSFDPRFGARIRDTPLELELPGLELNIRPLPPGAPADFTGAVGQFHLSTQCSKTLLNDTDSVELIIEVTGTGNLENLQAPRLTGDGWKIVDTSKITRGEERRLVSGKVTFRQLLRPERSRQLPSSIPPHSLSFFNPDNASYYTLTSSAIPVTITATLPPPAQLSDAFNSGEVPGTRPEEMRDILAFIRKPSTAPASAWQNPSYYWHLVPAVLCLALITIPAIRSIRARAARHPDQADRRNALAELAKTRDTGGFYQRAGYFIERWLEPDEQLDAILAERDQICFQPGESEPTPLSEQRRKEITGLLRQYRKFKLMLLLATLGCLGAVASPTAQAVANDSPDTAGEALARADYQQALELYAAQYPDPAETPADILYNIGNCHYRLDQPGQAALAWRRALARQAHHRAARQNLRFLELKQGSLVPVIKPWQQTLTNLPLHAYRITLQASLWLLLAALLILTLVRPRRNLIPVIVLVLSPLTAAMATLGMYFYPDTEVHTPFSAQAVCLQATPLHPEAQRQGGSPATIPPASLLVITASRGPWSHVQTADGQSGWVESSTISPVLPVDLPAVPSTALPGKP